MVRIATNPNVSKLSMPTNHELLFKAIEFTLEFCKFFFSIRWLDLEALSLATGRKDRKNVTKCDEIWRKSRLELCGTELVTANLLQTQLDGPSQLKSPAISLLETSYLQNPQTMTCRKPINKQYLQTRYHKITAHFFCHVLNYNNATLLIQGKISKGTTYTQHS